MTRVVEPSVLITGFQHDRLALCAVGLEVVALVLYGWGVRRLAARGRRWPLSSTSAFVAGVVLVWVAVGSGLAVYDDTNVTVHVIQHALLMMIAAPLLASGRPVTLASQAANRPTQVRILRVVHSPVVAGLSYPALGWAVYCGSMYACFADRRVYGYLAGHPLPHQAGHVLLLAVGYLYWQPLVGGDPSRWRPSPRVRTVSLVAATGAECLLGVIMMDFGRPLNPVSSLGDTHMAGLCFLVLAVVTCWFGGRLTSRQTGRHPARSPARPPSPQVMASVAAGWSGARQAK